MLKNMIHIYEASTSLRFPKVADDKVKVNEAARGQKIFSMIRQSPQCYLLFSVNIQLALGTITVASRDSRNQE